MRANQRKVRELTLLNGRMELDWRHRIPSTFAHEQNMTLPASHQSAHGSKPLQVRYTTLSKRNRDHYFGDGKGKGKEGAHQ